MFKIKKNDCKKCPYHGEYYDSFIGDGDEWCECGICEWGEIPSCKYPLFIRHLLAWKEKVRQMRYDKQAQKAYEKELAEMQKLGMNEDEYAEYQYNKLCNKADNYK